MIKAYLSSDHSASRSFDRASEVSIDVRVQDNKAEPDFVTASQTGRPLPVKEKVATACILR
jgi:hypothetical protein